MSEPSLSTVEDPQESTKVVGKISARSTGKGKGKGRGKKAAVDEAEGGEAVKEEPVEEKVSLTIMGEVGYR